MLGTGQSAENERQSPVVIGGLSGAIRRTATTRSSRGSTQQQVTQPVEVVSRAMLRTNKTGKPRQRIQWSEEINTFIMRQYYTITKLETMKTGYGIQPNPVDNIPGYVNDSQFRLRSEKFDDNNNNNNNLVGCSAG
jgi:hypothetical protein